MLLNRCLYGIIVLVNCLKFRALNQYFLPVGRILKVNRMNQSNHWSKEKGFSQGF